MSDLTFYKLSKSKLQETLKNDLLTDCLVKSIQFHQPSQNKLVLNLCSQSFPYSILHNVIVKLIDTGDISSSAQLDEAVVIVKEFKEQLDTVPSTFEEIEKLCNSVIAVDQIKKRCGVGLVVSDDQVIKFVKESIKNNNSVVNIKPLILREVRNDPILKFGNIPAMIKLVDKELVGYKPVVVQVSESEPANTHPLSFLNGGDISKLHKAGENPQINPELMKQHLKATGGKVVTRFPPEPNGFLHIGHAKAININFGYAEYHNGICYLRYDDTNPEAEEQSFIDGILQMVTWLGFKPHKITHSSDHFETLFNFAVQMIKLDKAYVDHSTAAEMHEQRGGESMGPRHDSKYRNRPIEESLLAFNKMKNGEYQPGTAILRLKMDMQSTNPYFWDPVAYRIILNKPHPRTGSQWCIYPTYDFTHCICDSLENITHSLCTTEFVHARESYYWILDQLQLYKPVQWEYGRLNINEAVTSKRKIVELVNSKKMANWDDPRLYTLVGLRRRGILPSSINTFVRRLGVTTSLTTIESTRFEQVVREELNLLAPRCFSVLEPLEIKLINVPDTFELRIPNVSYSDEKKRTLFFGNSIFIEKSDFNENEFDASFYRLQKGHSVGLLEVPFTITCINKIGNILHCRYDDPSLTNPAPELVLEKPRAYIQWVNPKYATNVSIRDGDDKGLLEIAPLEELIKEHWTPLTLKYSRCELNETAMDNEYAYTEKLKFQFVRTGYFQVDPSSDFGKLFKNGKLDAGNIRNGLKACKVVFNKTVGLREDNKKSQ